MPESTEPTSEASPQPEKPKSKGGRPKGIHTPLSIKKTYNAEQLAAGVAATLLEGKSLRSSPHLGPVTSQDRQHLARIAGESVEVFNERIATKLRDIADLAADRIKEHLEADNFKPGELGFIYSVAHDKRLTLDGSRALQTASINIQVNSYGSSPKETLLADLDGLSTTKQAIPA